MSLPGTRILGVDPGSRHTGWGMLEQRGNRLIHLASGRISAKEKDPLPQKLALIHLELTRIIGLHQPQEVAIEQIFHSVNPRSSLILGHARGVALLCVEQAGLPLFELTPTQVKQAVVGVGRAEKAQVKAMVQVLLNLKGQELAEDQADALAVAICHANLRGMMNLARGAQR